MSKPEDEKKGKMQLDLEKLTDGKIKGKVDVVDDETAFKHMSEGHPLVCCRVEDSGPLEPRFADNRIGRCAMCEKEIYYRPYNECATVKLCMYCVVDYSKAHEGEPS